MTDDRPAYTAVYANRDGSQLNVRHFDDQAALSAFCDGFRAQLCQPLVFLGRITPAGYTVVMRTAMQWGDEQ